MIQFLAQNWFYFIGAFAAAGLLIPVFLRFAPALKLVDQPGGRKVHEGAVPLIGGLVIFPVFIIGALLAGYPLATHGPFFAAIVLLLVTGAVDDRAHIRPAIKFAMQWLAAGLVVLAGDAQLYQLGDMFGLGRIGLGFMSIPFSVVAVVLLINAVNLMDGLDGLAAGFSFVALGWIAAAFAMNGDAGGVLIVGLLMAAIAGFLVHNMRSPILKRARVFLGDAGSMCLGLSLGWFAIHAANGAFPALEPISVAWVLAIPIMDTCAQFYRRMREGKHPFSPDRGHLHHHFGAAGISDGRAVLIILALAFVLGGYGVMGLKDGVPQVVLTVTWIICILAHMWVSEKPARYVSFWKSFKRSQ